MGICRFILVKAASFHDENWRFWSGLRDLNPRSLGPKPSAIPNFAKPGYSVGVFSDVVKHVVKGYFRPEQGRSQEEKALEPQRVFGLERFCHRFGAPAPKPGALPTGPHPGMDDTSMQVVLYTRKAKNAIKSFPGNQKPLPPAPLDGLCCHFFGCRKAVSGCRKSPSGLSDRKCF